MKKNFSISYFLLNPQTLKYKYMKSRFLIYSICILTCVSCKKQISEPPPNRESLSSVIQPAPPPFLTNFWTHLNSPDQQGFGYKNCSFSVNGKGYVILGIFEQLWEYDPATTVWTNKGATPHSVSTYAAVAFAIGSKGYFYTNDSRFWEYDPITNAWTGKQDFPGENRTHAVGFAVNGKGYIGSGFKEIPTGTDNTLNDFWEYNPATNQWLQKANTPGYKRGGAIGFGTSTRGYIGTGRSYFYFNGNYIGFYQNDWWEYNPVTNVWTQKTNYPGQSRIMIEGFVINDLLYMGIGSDVNGNLPNDFFRYNPSTDQWLIRNSPTELLSGQYTTGFSAGGHGYFVNGNLASFWRYTK